MKFAKNTVRGQNQGKSGARMGQGEPRTLCPSEIILTTTRELAEKELSLCEVGLTVDHPRCMKMSVHMIL